MYTEIHKLKTGFSCKQQPEIKNDVLINRCGKVELHNKR